MDDNKTAPAAATEKLPMPTPHELLVYRVDETTRALKDFMHTTSSSLDALAKRVDRGGDRQAQSDLNYRRSALEMAIKAGGSSHPRNLLVSSIAFENYLRDGTNTEAPPPAPAAHTQPHLPVSFADAAAVASLDCLYAIELVLRERARQVSKGYDAKHDDAHDDGRAGFEAAAAIMPEGASLLHPLHGPNFSSPDFEPWIDASQDRATVLVQGIALALAELERVHRANDRANLAAPPPAERAALAAAIPGSVDQLREAEGLPPLKSDDTWTQAARAIYAPIGKAEPISMEALAVGYSAAGPAQEVEPMTLQDFGKMHHALGNPRDPQAETYRNHYAANREGEIAPRLRMFPKFWEEDDGQAPKSAMAFFSVTDAGRAALAKAMTDNPEHFRIDVQNGPSVMPTADGD